MQRLQQAKSPANKSSNSESRDGAPTSRNQKHKRALEAPPLSMAELQALEQDSELMDSFFDAPSQPFSLDPDKTLTGTQPQVTKVLAETKSSSSSRSSGSIHRRKDRNASSTSIASSTQRQRILTQSTSQRKTTIAVSRQTSLSSVGTLSREASFKGLGREESIGVLSQYSLELDDFTNEFLECEMPETAEPSNAMDVDVDQDDSTNVMPEPDLGLSPAHPINVDSDDEQSTPSKAILKIASPGSQRSRCSQPDSHTPKKTFPPPSFATTSTIANHGHVSSSTTSKTPKSKPVSSFKYTPGPPPTTFTDPSKVASTSSSTITPARTSPSKFVPATSSRIDPASPSKGGIQTQLTYKSVHSPTKHTGSKLQTPLKSGHGIQPALMHSTGETSKSGAATATSTISSAQTSAKSTPAPFKPISASSTSTPTRTTTMATRPNTHAGPSRTTTSVLGSRTRSSSSEENGPGPSAKRARTTSSGLQARMGAARTNSDPENPFLTAASVQVPGTEPDIHNVADFGAMMQLIGKYAFGVRWEIERLMSKGVVQLSDINMTKLNQLKGSNAEAAPKVAKVLTDDFNDDAEGGPVAAGVIFDERAVKDPWRELDEEEAALKEWPFAGLGLRKPSSDPSTSFDSTPGTVPLEQHFGNVIFRAKLVRLTAARDAPFWQKFKLQLEAAELGPSSNYARRFGSENFIRVKIADRDWKNSSLGEDMREYFKIPFYIGGYVYRAFRAHGGNVFLMRTNEGWDGLASFKWTGIDEGLDYLGMMGLVNPMEMNAGQTMAKWASRFALGLSASVPGFQMFPRNIHFIQDEVSPEGSDMTDGCGLISRGPQIVIQRYLKLPWYPTAMQMRTCGSKGLAITMDSETQVEPEIRLRQSMQKIVLYRPLDPSQTIIDFLCSSHPKSPARLGYEWIINLHANKVPPKAFRQLIKTASRKRLEPLMSWAEGGVTDTRAMIALCVAVYKAGGVSFAKRRRLLVADARARGYGDVVDGDDDEEEDEENAEDEKVDAQRSVAWWPDAVSGCPSSLEETVVYLLSSGFCPGSCPILLMKLNEVLKKEVEAALRRCRFEVEMSATAFMVPDPTGLLKPDELFFRSSEANLMRPDGLKVDQISGVEVLATRSPCKLPTDVRKMKLVDIPQLRLYTNVVIFSIQGNRRPADYLGGGDYDGDKALLIWDPSLVEPFRNANLSFADEPQAAKDAFEQSIKTVSEFLEETRDIPREDKIRLIQDYTLSEIVTASKIGMYNQYYLQSLYTKGYEDPETTLLAYIFCTGLDGVRNGKTVKKEIAAAHEKKWGHTVLKWWKWIDEQKKANHVDLNELGQNEKASTKRPAHLESDPFIMDLIMEMVKTQKDEELANLERIVNGVKKGTMQVTDAHLVGPWEEACARAAKLKERGSGDMEKELAYIKAHVEKCYWACKETMTPSKNRSPSKKQGQRDRRFTSLSIETRQDILRRQSREFAEHSFPEECLIISAEDVTRYKASYAYKFGQVQSRDAYGNRFCWNVAMRSMCEIKAKALGWTKTVSADFYEVMEPRALLV